jgi:hypothetical protein
MNLASLFVLLLAASLGAHVRGAAGEAAAVTTGNRLPLGDGDQEERGAAILLGEEGSSSNHVLLRRLGSGGDAKTALTTKTVRDGKALGRRGRKEREPKLALITLCLPPPLFRRLLFHRTPPPPPPPEPRRGRGFGRMLRRF